MNSSNKDYLLIGLKSQSITSLKCAAHINDQENAILKPAKDATGIFEKYNKNCTLSFEEAREEA